MQSTTPSFSNTLYGVGTVLSGIAGIGAQQRAYDAQMQQYNAQADYQAALIRQQVEQNYNDQLAIRQEQAQQQEILNRQRIVSKVQTQQGKSSAAASAAARGVSGASVLAALQEYEIQGSMYLEGLDRQQQMLAAATETNIESIGNRKYIPGLMEKPMKAPMISGIGSVLADTFSLFDARQKIVQSEMLKL